jgi:hypothetical protein
MKKVYGVEPKIGSRMVGPNPTDMQKDLAARWIERYQRVLSGETVQFEESRNGIDVVFSLSPIMEGDNVVGASNFCENITKRKARDRELAEANKKIEELKHLEPLGDKHHQAG